MNPKTGKFSLQQVLSETSEVVEFDQKLRLTRLSKSSVYASLKTLLEGQQMQTRLIRELQKQVQELKK